MSLESLFFLGLNFDFLENRMVDFSIISSRSAWYSQEGMSDIPIFVNHVLKLKLGYLSVSLFGSFVGIPSFQFSLSILFQ